MVNIELIGWTVTTGVALMLLLWVINHLGGIIVLVIESWSDDQKFDEEERERIRKRLNRAIIVLLAILGIKIEEILGDIEIIPGDTSDN